MGLNSAYVLVIERRELPRLEGAIAARLCRHSAGPNLTSDAERSIEEGEYRFATTDSSACLSFVDPTFAD